MQRQPGPLAASLNQTPGHRNAGAGTLATGAAFAASRRDHDAVTGRLWYSEFSPGIPAIADAPRLDHEGLLGCADCRIAPDTRLAKLEE